jgi:GxxExxY protein
MILSVWFRLRQAAKLCDGVRKTGFAIHRHPKHGHMEKVYENRLAPRLRKLGLDVKQQCLLKVYDDEDGALIGDYSADLFVDNRLIIELKAASAPRFEAEANSAARVTCQSKALGRAAASLMTLLPSRMLWSKLVCRLLSLSHVLRYQYGFTTWRSVG